ncbi:E3 ubiquitin-protein ligase RNF144A isoform X1 [Piliocolobus tephrosceles]|uniref:E3 ubiquitin-protein ligase RNF144A isoform X1 n=1 Tax=Piliocolobus tephrosceles TaxID=591936 RepID=UPI000C2AD4D2|nr:E3 ubiquitin-protein ligase RNF144A isoform X1 [Piliocolobus tephrosceles]
MTTARYRPTWDLALDPLVSCKLCLGEYPVEQMTTIAQCQCIFCTLCLKQYVELLIKEGLETAISCPDAACPKQGHLQENEIECMVAAEIMQRYKKLQFEREVLFDPCRTWCPASTCQAVCQLQDVGLQTPQPVQCKACHMEFCSTCKASWHPGQGCPETMPITFLPGETSAAFKMEEDDAPIKRCPKCRVYIERDEGCAQMMCKNCKHAFCWYCLESLDDDFLLIHYDKGPCRNKLGHSRASVIWHRTQGSTLSPSLGRSTPPSRPSSCSSPCGKPFSVSSSPHVWLLGNHSALYFLMLDYKCVYHSPELSIGSGGRNDVMFIFV